MQYLTTNQAASIVHVAPATIRRWVRQGKITPEYYTRGGHARFARVAIDDLAQEYRREGSLTTKAKLSFTNRDWFALSRKQAGLSLTVLACLVVSIWQDSIVRSARKVAWVGISGLSLAGFIVVGILTHDMSSWMFQDVYESAMWSGSLFPALILTAKLTTLAGCGVIMWAVYLAIFDGEIRQTRRRSAVAGAQAMYKEFS